MEKDRSSKVIAIVALIVAVLGVSLGFAAFSANLTINATATVKGDNSKFSVVFSTEQKSVSEDTTVEPTLDPLNGGSIEGFAAENANIAATTISNLQATFVNGKSEQKVTYDFFVHNAGQLTAYLKKVNFSKESPECTATAENGASESYLTNACSDVDIKVTVDDQPYDATTPNITTKSIDAGDGVAVSVELSYSDTNQIDGDFTVNFGTITLDYSSSDENE